MIRFESYGGSKLDEIGPDDVFCYIRLLQGHPEASSDGFRGFQRGLKPCGFRGVSEWYKTVGGFRGFKRKVI